VKISVTHSQIADLMRELHRAGIAFVVCELTGPGWIVEFRGQIDVSKYRVIA
jgi:predicted peroxiredoxin